MGGVTLRRARFRVKASGIHPSRADAGLRQLDNAGPRSRRPHDTMTSRHRLLRLAAFGALAASLPAHAAAPPGAARLEAIADQVRAREIAFARTLADRRLDRFADFVAE